MGFAAILPILGQIAVPILKNIFGGPKRDQWFDALGHATEGVGGAIGAFEKLKDFTDRGETPSEDDLDAALELSRAKHEQIQDD